MSSITQSQIDAYRTLMQFKTAVQNDQGDDDAVFQFKDGRVSKARGEVVMGLFKAWKAPGRDEVGNDLTRKTIKDAVLQLFNVTSDKDLPEDVLDAITSGSLGSDEKSGKPLSARRIIAVLDAVKDSRIYKALDTVQTVDNRVRENLSPKTREGAQSLADLESHLVTYANHIAGLNARTDALAPKYSGLKSEIAEFYAKIGRLVKNPQCQGPGEYQSHVEHTFNQFKASARQAVKAANPRAGDAQVERALAPVFAEACAILNRLVVRKEMLNAFQDKFGGDQRLEAVIVRDLEMLEDLVFDKLDPASGDGRPPEMAQRDIGSVHAGISAAVTEIVDKYNNAFIAPLKDLPNEIAKFKAAVGMSADQEALFDALDDRLQDKLEDVLYGHSALTYSNGKFEVGRGGNQGIGIAVLARLATGGKPMPKIDTGILVNDSELKAANDEPVNRFCLLSKGKERKAAQFVGRFRLELANYILSDPQRTAVAFSDGEALTRRSLHAALFPDEPFDASLDGLDDERFGKKMYDELFAKLVAKVDEETQGQFDPVKVAKIAVMPFGSSAPIIDVNTGISLFDVPKDGVHLTLRDVKGADGLMDPDEAKAKGRAALKEQLGKDVSRTESIVWIGDESFDLVERCKSSKADDVAEELITALERLCGGNEAQALVLGWGLAQSGSTLEHILEIPGNEHAAAEMRVTRDPATGNVQFTKKNIVPDNAPVKLSCGYLVKPDGTSEMNALTFDKRNVTGKGTIKLSEFRNIAADTTMPADATVVITNDDRTKIGFGQPDPQDKALLRYHLKHDFLLAVRDELGGTDSEAYRKIRDLLYDAGAAGRWYKKVTPITKGEIVQVLKILNEELLRRLDPGKMEDVAKYNNLNGRTVTIGTGEEGDRAQSIRDFMGKVLDLGKLDVDFNLAAKFKNKTDAWKRFLYGIADNVTGLGTVNQEDKIPKQFKNDCNRTSYFVIGDRKMTLSASADNKVSMKELKDELARFVTDDPHAEFETLQGNELKRAQFVMANIHQKIVTNIYDPVKDDILGDMTINGIHEIGYAVKRDGNGGFVFTGFYQEKPASLYSWKLADGPNGMAGAMCFCTPEKSFVNTTVEFSYTKDRVDEICEHDWTCSNDKQNPTDPDYVAPSTFNVYVAAQFDV